MLDPRCPFCEHPNPAAAKFCNDCGSPLHLKPCLQCDAINDGSVKFCYMCGAPFAERESDSAVAVLRAHRMAAAVRDESISADAAANAEQEPARRGVVALLLPAVIFGAIAIGTYFLGYQGVLPLREWASATLASVSPNRDTTSAPAARETPSAPTMSTPPTETTTAPAAGSADSTRLNHEATAPEVPPPDAVPPETTPAAPTGVPPAPTAKKASTSHKAGAKKTKNAAAKKSTATTSQSASKPGSGQN